MCGERIYPLLRRGKYGDIQRVLREIEATFATHALTLIQIGAYKVVWHGADPSVLYGLANIEQSLRDIVFHFVHNQTMMTPRNFKYSPSWWKITFEGL